MQTCPGFLLKSLLEYPGNLLEICSVKSVDTLTMYSPVISKNAFWSFGVGECTLLENFWLNGSLFS